MTPNVAKCLFFSGGDGIHLKSGSTTANVLKCLSGANYHEVGGCEPIFCWFKISYSLVIHKRERMSTHVWANDSKWYQTPFLMTIRWWRWYSSKPWVHDCIYSQTPFLMSIIKRMGDVNQSVSWWFKIPISWRLLLDGGDAIHPNFVSTTAESCNQLFSFLSAICQSTFWSMALNCSKCLFPCPIEVGRVASQLVVHDSK